MKRCQDKVALIAGGASKAGATAARMLLAEGAKVLIADANASLAGEVARSIGADTGSVALDVTDARSWTAAGEAVLQAFGRWDVLVNCAGYFCRGSVESLRIGNWERISKVNIAGAWRGCQAGVHNFKSSGGSIINIASVAGIVAGPDRCAYDMACGAVRLLTKSVALYCIDQGYQVRCNSIHPDLTAAMLCHEALDDSEGWENPGDIFVGPRGASRLGTVSDIGHMIVYLASDESAAVTGAEMVIDGGRTAR